MNDTTTSNATAARRPRRTLADEIVNLKGDLQETKQAAETEIAALRKKVESAESMQRHYAENARKSDLEIEQISALLDALEGAPPRRKQVETRYGSTETVELGAITRLSAYLAQRK